MGKCIKCGKETQNEYEYYSADLIDNITRYTHVAQQITTYGNFEKHQDYYCSRHQIWSCIGALLGFLISIVLFIWLMNSMDKQHVPLWVVIFSAVAGLAALIRFFYIIQKIKTDGRIEEEAGISIIVIKRKNNPKKTFFTPKEFNKLKKK